MSGANASTGSTVIGPTPSIVWRRRAVSVVSASFLQSSCAPRCGRTSWKSAAEDPGIRCRPPLSQADKFLHPGPVAHPSWADASLSSSIKTGTLPTGQSPQSPAGGLFSHPSSHIDRRGQKIFLRDMLPFEPLSSENLYPLGATRAIYRDARKTTSVGLM